MIAVTRHRDVEDNVGPYHWQGRKTMRVSEDLLDITAEMDDKVCAAMLRGLADALDPSPDRPASDPVQEWERDLLRGAR